MTYLRKLRLGREQEKKRPEAPDFPSTIPEVQLIPLEGKLVVRDKDGNLVTVSLEPDKE
jgi:hypothetical protein